VAPHRRGSYVFIEHVAAREGSWTRRAQNAYTLRTGRLGSACRVNLGTAALIERAGFSTVTSAVTPCPDRWEPASRTSPATLK